MKDTEMIKQGECAMVNTIADEYRNVQNSLTLLGRRIETRDLHSDINIPISSPTQYSIFHFQPFLFIGHHLLTPALPALPLDFNINLGSSQAETRYWVAMWTVTFFFTPAS